VRSRACQCLALVPKQLKREAVLPFRRQIVKKLSAVLDDKKRKVRSEAVKCRTAWLALEEAEEED
jgi:DNA repair/transcription protein MET18/MMS19